MRIFIAIELDEEIKETLSKIQSELKSMSLDIKWVEPQNIHLTIKFLGEVKESKIPKINQALKETCNYIKPFVIETENMGVFPNIKFPRVIWVGFKEENEELKKLVNLLEEKLAKLKFSRTYPEINRREGRTNSGAETRSEDDGVVEEALRKARTTQSQAEKMASLPTSGFGIGSKEKRAFSAHLTLGRFRSQKNKEDFIEKLNQIKVAKLRQEVKSVKLFKSTITSEGPIYEKLNEENFKKL